LYVKRSLKRHLDLRTKVTRLAKDVAMLKKELISDVERKNLYISFAATQIDNNGTMSAVANSIIQGDGIYERIGRAVKCSGIDFRYHLTANSPTVAAAMRVIVILDKTNSISTSADLLHADPTFTLGNSRACMSYYNRNNRETFTVLYDKMHDFDYATGDFQVYERVSLRENHVTKFVDDSALITENAIRVFAISDQGLASAARPTIEWVMAYYYTDQ